MIDASTLVDNMLSPAVLCFVLGVIARLIKSDLRIPEAMVTGLSIYLLFAIGLKGGESLAIGGEGLALASLAILVMGSLIPLMVYAVAQYIGRWEGGEAASLAAHYGSTSAVTFFATIAFLENQNISQEGYMPALLAMMEVPAIVIGLILSQRAVAQKRQAEELQQAGRQDSTSLVAVHHSAPLGDVLIHVICGKTVLLLIGGMIIGMISSPGDLDKVKPFFVDPFAGVLALFLLELGVIAGGSLKELRKRAVFLIPFGICAPLINGTAGVAVATLVGLSPGGATCFGILCGSASYIAAPAALRMACPQVDHGIALSASLGVTFPFNLILGIPTLSAIAQYLGAANPG